MHSICVGDVSGITKVIKTVVLKNAYYNHDCFCPKKYLPFQQYNATATLAIKEINNEKHPEEEDDFYFIYLTACLFVCLFFSKPHF